MAAWMEDQGIDITAAAFMNETDAPRPSYGAAMELSTEMHQPEPAPEQLFPVDGYEARVATDSHNTNEAVLQNHGNHEAFLSEALDTSHYVMLGGEQGPVQVCSACLDSSPLLTP